MNEPIAICTNCFAENRSEIVTLPNGERQEHCRECDLYQGLHIFVNPKQAARIRAERQKRSAE